MSLPEFKKVPEGGEIPEGFSQYVHKDYESNSNYNAIYARHNGYTVFIRCDKHWNIVEMCMVDGNNNHLTSEFTSHPGVAVFNG